MTDDELLSALNDLRTVMINVATGGPRINDVNGDYQRVFASVAADLARRRIDNPITFGSLWDWYARWSSGDLPTYQSRRNFISELINPLLNRIRTGRQMNSSRQDGNVLIDALANCGTAWQRREAKSNSKRLAYSDGKLSYL
jgi:hypothetical protein